MNRFASFRIPAPCRMVLALVLSWWCAASAVAQCSSCSSAEQVTLRFKQAGHFAGTIRATILVDGVAVGQPLVFSAGSVTYDSANARYVVQSFGCGEWSAEVPVISKLEVPITIDTTWVNDPTSPSYTELDPAYAPLAVATYVSYPTAQCLSFFVDPDGRGQTWVPHDNGTILGEPLADNHWRTLVKARKGGPDDKDPFCGAHPEPGSDEASAPQAKYNDPAELGVLCGTVARPAAAAIEESTVSTATKPTPGSRKVGLVAGKQARSAGALRNKTVDVSRAVDASAQAHWEKARAKRASVDKLHEAKKSDGGLVADPGPAAKSKDSVVATESGTTNVAASDLTAAAVPGERVARPVGALHMVLPLGAKSGSLKYEAAAIDAGAYSPLRLELEAGAVILDRVNDTNGALRQVLLGHGLIDVATVSPSNFTIRFFGPGQFAPDTVGYLVNSGAIPQASWTIENPDATPLGRVRFTGNWDGRTVVHLATWRAPIAPDAGQMTLSLDSGAVVEERTYTLSTSGSPTRTERIKRRRGSGPVESDTREVYGEYYNWGQAGEVFEAMIERTLDPDGAQLSTFYGYYDVTTQPARGLAWVIFPDGNWERYDRFSGTGDLARTYRPFLDSPASPFAATTTNCELASVTYGYPDAETEQKTTQTVINGTTTIGYSIETTNIAGNFVETTERFLSGGAETIDQTAKTLRQGAVLSSYSHEGTLTTYGRLWGYWDPVARTFHGSPASGRIVAQRTITTLGTQAQPGGIPFKTTISLSYQDAEGRSLLDQTFVNDGTPFVPGARSDWIHQTLSTYDARGLLVSRETDGRISLEAGYDAAGQLLWQVDEAGVRTEFGYDNLARLVRQTVRVPGRPDVVTDLTLDAEGRSIAEATAAGAGASRRTMSATRSYDLAGRLVSSTGSDGLTTTLLEEILFDGSGYPAHRLVTTTNPDLSQRVEEYSRDRRLIRRTGSAVPSEYWSYGFYASGYAIAASYRDSARTQMRAYAVTDWAGNSATELVPTTVAGQYFTRSHTYGGTGLYGTSRALRIATTETGHAPTLFEFDELGRPTAQGLDYDGNGVLDRAGTDPIAITDVSFERVGVTPIWWATSERRRLEADSVATETLVARERSQLSGLTAPVVSVREALLPGGGSTRETVSQDRATATRTVSTLDLATNDAAVSTDLAGLVQSVHRPGATANVTYLYDSLGRLESVSDPLTGTVTQSYNAQGLVESVTDSLSRETRVTYFPTGQRGAGQVASRRDPAGLTTYSAYDSRGRVWRQWGANTYPQQFGYDDDNQLVSLRTFRSVDLANGGSVDWTTSTWPANAPAGDLTQWIYNSVGLLERKRYADSSEVVYAYDTALRVASKTNARNQVATYTYDSTKSGQLTGTSYSAGSATPAVTFAYDRALRVNAVTDAAGGRTLGYAATGQLNAETYTGLLAGQSIGRTFVDGRPETLTAGSAYSARWSYDSLGRPQTYTGETGAFAGLAVGYGYQTGSNRIASTTWRSGGIAKSYATRSYDALGRLTDITTRLGDPAGSSSIARRFGYSQFDAMDRRQVVEGEDGGRWNYAYNDRGEVRSAQRRDVSNTVLPGHSYAYDFDTIGNRTSSSGQGNSSYTANALNQYSQRTVAGEIGVLGTAASDAILSADFQRMARTGEWFSGVLAVNNSSAPVWKSFDVVAVRNNAGASGEDMVASATKTAFVAKTPEVFTHDLDGNLIADGRWTYTWDAENRLLSMETGSAAVTAGAPRTRLEFTYDAQSRRTRKVVKSWTGSAFATQSDTRFLYDNWNLVAELDGLAANALTRSHAWGLDLSGSLQGAGGVGGLLAVRTGSATYVPAQDGNGNITGLIDLGTVSLAARYEYGAFGETILASGPAATATPWRFSSKYFDAETTLLYYGFRYYNPSTGRWLSRDPIQEGGGINVFASVQNAPTGKVDSLGLETIFLAPPRGYSGPYVNSSVFSGGTAGARSVAAVRAANGVMTAVNWMYFMMELEQLEADAFGIPRPYDARGLVQVPYNEGMAKFWLNRQGETADEDALEQLRMEVEVFIKPAKVFNKESESVDDKTCCRFIWDRRKLGGWKQHDAYTRYLFNPDLELVVIAPDGDNARYDGGFNYPSPVHTVVEAKTGRRWFSQPRNTWSPKQMTIAARDEKQRLNQLRVARKCKLSYFTYFSDRVAAEGAAETYPGWDSFFKNVQYP